MAKKNTKGTLLAADDPLNNAIKKAAKRGVDPSLLIRARDAGATIGGAGRLQQGGQRIELTNAIVKQLEKNAKQNAKTGGNPKSTYPGDASGVIGGRDPLLYEDPGEGNAIVYGGGGAGTYGIGPSVKGTSQGVGDIALNDANYKAALAALGKSWANFSGGIADQKNQFNAEYADSLRRLGYNPETERYDYGRDSDFGKDFAANQGDFASRGTYWSGPRLNAETDQRNTYADRGASMMRAKNAYLSGLDRQLAAQQAQNEALEQNAYQQALNKQLNNIATGNSLAPSAAQPIKKSGATINEQNALKLISGR